MSVYTYINMHVCTQSHVQTPCTLTPSQQEELAAYVKLYVCSFTHKRKKTWPNTTHLHTNWPRTCNSLCVKHPSRTLNHMIKICHSRRHHLNTNWLRMWNANPSLPDPDVTLQPDHVLTEGETADQKLLESTSVRSKLYMNVCVCVCIYIYMSACTFMYMLMNVVTRSCRLKALASVCIQANERVYMYVNVWVQTRSHTY